jgi:3-oxoadipate enol-lactonase
MNFVDINGITLHYKMVNADSGKPVIVFSNSLGTDFRIWDACVADLAADFAILLYDKRGHGLSGLGTPPYAIDDHVSDLAGLMDHLGIGTAAVCGLSVGGLIAQGLYHKRPDLVQALILCDTGAKIGDAQMWNDRMAIVENGGLDALVEVNMQRWFSPAFHKDRAVDLAGYSAMFTRTPQAGYLGTGAAIRDADFRDQAGAITVPTICVVGDQDGATPPALVKSTADLIPGAGFEVVANAGHIPCAEQPAAVIKIIRDMMAKL